jgi:PIN domain nuclease of toxin-antitoxin system
MAVILEERGAEVVLPQLRGAMLSSVNFSETASRLAEKKSTTAAEVIALLQRFDLEISPFDSDLALIAAELRPLTRHIGASFADRACLALGSSKQTPILTADSKWAELDLDIDIRLIR